MLVNNVSFEFSEHLFSSFITLLQVGVESGEPCPYMEKNREDVDSIIDVNIRFSSQITLSLLSLLIKNCKEYNLKGAIINLSSNASILDSPLLVAYTAAKTWNRCACHCYSYRVVFVNVWLRFFLLRSNFTHFILI